MSLNCVEIEKIISEINLSLDTAFVNEIYQTDYYSLVFMLSSRNEKISLNVCLLADKTRIGFLYSKRKKTTQQRFCQFLRATITSAKILSVEQLNYQRVVLFKLKKADTLYNLYLKLWTNSGNILLCDENNIIVDSFSLRPQKGEIKGEKFTVENNLKVDISKYKLVDFDSQGESLYGFNIETYYLKKEYEEKLRLLKEKLDKEYNNKLNFLNSKIENIQKQKKNSNSLIYRQYGDLIFANIYKYKENDRLEKLELKDYEGNFIEIPLDIGKSLKENAGLYYQKAKKQEQKIKFAYEEEQVCLSRLDSLEKRYKYLKTITDIDLLTQELESFKEVSKKQNIGVKETIYLEYFSNNFQILVGKDSATNVELLKRYVRGNDTWLHVRDYPGAYVFIKTKKDKSVPLEVLLDAGNIALFHSKAKANGSADLHYTFVKYLKKISGKGNEGLVIPTQEKNLFVRLDNQRLSRLLGKNEFP